MSDVDLFAVAAGPGSFTGLRIGIATMQGLSMANGKPLLGISALDAIHDAIHHLSPKPSALSPVSEVAIWMDAQRGQVFSAVYRNGEIREEPAVDTADATLFAMVCARDCSGCVCRRRRACVSAGDYSRDCLTRT